MCSSSEEVPTEIGESVLRATSDLLPSKSKEQYNFAYGRFMDWCKSKKVEGNYSENVLLAFFEEKSKIWKSSTLWANYSMIRTLLSINNNQDISKYHKLKAFLKRKGDGYRPKKSKTLSKEEIDAFIREAPDEQYLMIKVAMIMGLFGACRRDELCAMTIDNIQELENELRVSILDTKNKVPRTFTVVGTTYLQYYRKYKALRPSHINHRRFFIKYMMSNKCSCLPVGINTFGKMPVQIAAFLKLPEPALYTGHCFRRSSASLLADSGANLITIKRHGGWKSSTVAEGYIEDSAENKRRIANQILPATSVSTVNSDHSLGSSVSLSDDNNCLQVFACKNSMKTQSDGITISNLTNCSITLNISK